MSDYIVLQISKNEEEEEETIEAINAMRILLAERKNANKQTTTAITIMHGVLGKLLHTAAGYIAY